jgi:hypothetical protein
VQEVQKWITNVVRQTVFEHINCPVLEEAVRKIIADRVAGWNWKIDLGEASPFVTKTNVVLGAVESVRGMECITTLQEQVEKQIVMAIGSYSDWRLRDEELTLTAGMMNV